MSTEIELKVKYPSGNEYSIKHNSNKESDTILDFYLNDKFIGYTTFKKMMDIIKKE